MKPEMPGFVGQFEHRANDNAFRKVTGFRSGKLIAAGEKIGEKIVLSGPVRLFDAFGNRWEEGEYSFFMPGYFNNLEGRQKFPRPFVQNPLSGVQVQQGDILLISFLNENLYNPIVFPSMVPFEKSEFFRDNDLGESVQERRENEHRIIEIDDNGKGKVFLKIESKPNGDQIEIVFESGVITARPSTQLVIEGKTMLGGSDAYQRAVLGEQLTILINSLIATFNTHTHSIPGITPGTSVALSQPPVILQITMMNDAQLSTTTKVK